MKVWISDGYDRQLIDAPDGTDLDEVARQWLADYEVGQIDSTVWLHSTAWSVGPDGEPEDEIGSATVAVDPPVPPCIVGQEHVWSPRAKVLAHVGGVIIQETCERCGVQRVTDTWAQDLATGTQGLRSISYSRQSEEARS